MCYKYIKKNFQKQIFKIGNNEVPQFSQIDENIIEISQQVTGYENNIMNEKHGSISKNILIR